MVVVISVDLVFVDVGVKVEGIFDCVELFDKDGKLTVKVGSSVTARVVDTRNDNIMLRKRMGRGDSAAEQL